MLLACLMVVALLTASIFIQYESLRLISLLVDHTRGPPRRLILLVVAGALVAHMSFIGVLWIV
jgi:hypothetical protein